MRVVIIFRVLVGAAVVAAALAGCGFQIGNHTYTPVFNVEVRTSSTYEGDGTGEAPNLSTPIANAISFLEPDCGSHEAASRLETRGEIREWGGQEYVREKTHVSYRDETVFGWGSKCQ